MVPRVIEFFLKDDANHDPLIAPEAIVAQDIASPPELGAMTELARLTFDILAHAWRRRDVLLVDLKIEFGRLISGANQGQLVIADVIDNDSWRIWPQGREDLMLDKQCTATWRASTKRRSPSETRLREVAELVDLPGDAAGHGRGHRRRARAHV